MVFGQAMFLIGLDTSILPIGRMVGGSFSKYNNLVFVLCFGFVFGLLATVAEPALSVLAKQISEPVRWEQIVRHMINSGADTFIEVGPGSVLSGLIGKIDKNVRTFQVYDRESLENCVREVSEC